jgi:hypothetical protein
MLYGELREPLLKLGYRPIPIEPRTKVPVTKAWQKPETPTPTGYRNYSIGVVCGLAPHPICAIDADILDESLAGTIRDHILNKYGETIYRIGRAPKVLLLYRAERTGIRKQTSAKYTCGKIEILGEGQQFIAHGFHQAAKRPYFWPGILGDIVNTSAADLPILPETAISEIIAFFENTALARGFTISDTTRTISTSNDYDPDNALDVDDPIGKTIDEVKDLLDKIDPDIIRDKWLRIGMALHYEFKGDPEAFNIWDEWSSSGDKYPCVENLFKQWSGFGKSRKRPITLKTLLWYAKGEESVEPEAAEPAAPADVVETPPATAAADTPPTEALWTAKTMHAGHFINTHPPVLDWVVPGLLPLGLTGIISGEGGESYKSTLMLDLCMTKALAGVIPDSRWLFRFPVNKSGRCLYLSLEDSHDAIHRRIHTIFARKCLYEKEDECRKAYSDNFLVLTREMFFDDTKHTTLLDKEGKPTKKLTRLKAAILDARPELVIIDTRSKASSVDENDNALNSRLMSIISGLCNAGENGTANKATVLIISHVSKAVRSGLETNGLNSVRGAGSLGDDARWILWIRPTGEQDKDGYPLIELVNAKNSYASKIKPFLVGVKWPEFVLSESSRDELKSARAEAKENELKNKILDLLSDNKERSAEEIRVTIKKDRNCVLDVIAKMTVEGFILRKKIGKEVKYSTNNETKYAV